MSKDAILSAFQPLRKHYQQIAHWKIADGFASDPKRADRYSLSLPGLFVDFSKNHITDETLRHLIALAKAAQVEKKREDLFAGNVVNITENRAALHPAFRQVGKSIHPDLSAQREKMKHFVASLREGHHLGASGKPITDFLLLGIGGSQLGTKMAITALSRWVRPDWQFHFLSNLDGYTISNQLKQLNPETTLCFISSKSFTTQETLSNAEIIKTWLSKMGNGKHKTATIFEKHLVALTAKPEKALAFGLSPAMIFSLPNEIGGRYSLWSAMGLPLMTAIGEAAFTELLKGGYAMDQHFREAPIEKNLPVILGLIGIWYRHFFQAQTTAIIAYSDALTYFPAYLQQLVMESQGKSVSQSGEPIPYPTSPIVWGGVGCDSQHAYHQLLHQGTVYVPVDFLLPLKAPSGFEAHQAKLVANCLGQSQSLMRGKTTAEAYQELLSAGYAAAEASRLAPHYALPGNRASHTFLLDEVTPYTLGMLIALYEHKVFVQSVIWGINPFDQFGVEWGKQKAHDLLPLLLSKEKITPTLDASTAMLIAKCRQKI